jgi:hypothetical protein
MLNEKYEIVSVRNDVRLESMAKDVITPSAFSAST